MMNRSRNRSRSRLQSITLTAATVSLVLLAGCTSIQDKSNEAIGKTTAALEQSVINVAEDWTEKRKNDAELSRDITTKQQIGQATKISLDNSVGSITVRFYEGEDIRVNTTIWFNKSSKKDSKQRILDQAEVSLIEKGDQLVIVTHPKDKPNESLWKWSEKKYGVSDFNIDYIVEVPAKIESYNVNNDVGAIELQDLQGSYDISSDVGSIRIDNAHIIGKSSIKTSTGSIGLHIAEMNQDSQLEVKTDVGNIKVMLDDAVQCTLITKNEVGKIIGAEKGTSDINGGGGALLLQSEIGNITVE